MNSSPAGSLSSLDKSDSLTRCPCQRGQCQLLFQCAASMLRWERGCCCCCTAPTKTIYSVHSLLSPCVSWMVFLFHLPCSPSSGVGSCLPTALAMSCWGVEVNSSQELPVWIALGDEQGQVTNHRQLLAPDVSFCSLQWHSCKEQWQCHILSLTTVLGVCDP